MTPMQMRELNVGCFGGGTGQPSLLGGLKRNPWLMVHAVVTMFDSGGSSGQLRDELGVLPPGDVLKCALALARNEGEARRVLLSRLPTLEYARLSMNLDDEGRGLDFRIHEPAALPVRPAGLRFAHFALGGLASAAALPLALLFAFALSALLLLGLFGCRRS